jgi:DNA primase catalytic core
VDRNADQGAERKKREEPTGSLAQSLPEGTSASMTKPKSDDSASASEPASSLVAEETKASVQRPRRAPMSGSRRLELLKRSVLIEELVKASGVLLEKQGSLWLGRCPYHDDNEELSLVLNARTNTWRCEPCQAGGDVLSWLMKREGLDFGAALERLKSLVARGEATSHTEAAPAKPGRLSISSSLAEELAKGARRGPWSGRVAQEDIDRVKRDVSIVSLVEGSGVKLTGHGDNLIGLCALHDDRNPSLVVSPSKNVWHCFGACQAGGSVIDWIMRAKKVSFRRAVEILLADKVGKGAPERPKVEPLAKSAEPMAAVLVRAVSYYHQVAKDSAELLAYLDKRGLRHSEVIDHFKIGYANRTLGFRLPPRTTKAGIQLRDQLHQLGILTERGHERLTGSLTIPVFSDEGEVLELYARKLNPYLRPAHLYLPARPDGRRGVFNLQAVKSTKEILLAEALIDALTLWTAGFRNVTSAYGVEGFTEEMRAALIEHGVRRVLIAYDADEAGNRAAAKLAPELGAEGIEVFRVHFPKGMDANEYALKVTPAAKAFETAIMGAEWMAGPRPVVVPAEIERMAVPVIDPERDSVSVVQTKTASNEIPVLKSMTMADHAESEIAAAKPVSPAVEAEHARIEGPAHPEEPSPLAADRAPDDAPAVPGSTLVDADVTEDQVRIRLGDRRWRIRGIWKATTYESLHVNLLVARGEAFYVDNLELYSARARQCFQKEAAKEVRVEPDVIASDVGRIVLKLEDLVHQRITKALEQDKKSFKMSEEARAEALALLRDPKLVERIVHDFDKGGIVGESTNLIVGYLAATSRKLERPLAVVIQSSSAAGKSSLAEAILRFMPEEERVAYSAMTGQSLYYLGEHDLEHKILSIAEEQGASSAAYALKLLQSEGQLRIASTGKDATSGKLVTQTYVVRGPTMIFLTTTAIEVDEELLNRCLVLTVDEGAKQTSLIHARQRELETLEGLLMKHDKDAIARVHQNAQRLLEPVAVINPLAKSLRFESHATRTRRDHVKYLTLIQAIALLHQHQRPIKEIAHRGERIRYVEVTEADIAIADRLASQVLGSSTDELPPQTQRLLLAIQAMVKARAAKESIDTSAVRFTRKDVRAHTRWSDAALKKHLSRLEDLEHLIIHGGGARRRLIYELVAPSMEDLVTPKAIWSPLGHPSGVTREARDGAKESASGHALVEGQIRRAANGALHAGGSQTIEVES